MGDTLIDLTGKKFNRLTVIKRSYPNNKRTAAMWLCECVCGAKKIIRGQSLRVGHTQSCGCLQKEHLKNCHKINFRLASIRAVILLYKARAKKRGYEWGLTEEQFKELTQQSCYYCGAKPSNIGKARHNNGEYIYNGLDRIDNNKGYTTDNIVPCCKICNRAKYKMTTKEFKDWIKKSYSHLFCSDECRIANLKEEIRLERRKNNNE